MRERLVPPWWVFIVGGIVPVMIGVAYGAAFSVPLGTAVSLIGIGLVTVFLFRTSPVVRASEQGGLSVGRAHLPPWAVGPCHAVAIEDARTALRTDGSAYVVLRAWYSNKVLVVTVEDADDPHRRWYVSVREPETFILALRGR
jgi:hypothetical protein